MKLRIKNQALRLRLTDAEMATLALVGYVEDAVAFGPDHALCYKLALRTDIEAPSILFEAGTLSVEFPAAQGQEWLTGEIDSLRAELPTGGDEPMSLKLERENRRREKEQKADAEELIELRRSPFFESSDRYDVDEEIESFMISRGEASD